ncbi:MAG: TetR/AcrR family transcriptional regulator [Planctomycetota bacterium]|jgi:AcrR family transcriptional regulator
MSSFAEKQREMKEKAAQEAIFEATVQLISETDGQGLKMQDIAEVAGIATGTLYNYFTNKVELLYFVDRRLHALILQQIGDIAGSELTPKKKLEQIILGVLGFCQTYHGVFDLGERFGIKNRVPRQEKSNNYNHVCGCIRSIIEEGIGQNHFRQVNAEAVSEQFFTSIVGAIEVQKWLEDYDMNLWTDKLMSFYLEHLIPDQS